MPSPIYAIGDIHGQIDELHRVLDLIERDGGQHEKTVFLGDYVDRGPDSRGVIEHLIQGRGAGRNWITLMGNHDRMFLWFMQDPPRHDPHLLVGFHWLHDRLGGRDTLASYGVEWQGDIRLEDVRARAEPLVPKAHLEFLTDLDLCHETETLFFAHAGIRPGVALDRQNENDLIWIRKAFGDFTAPHPKLIVHGHTPVAKATHFGNRINLDSGAGYGEPLSAAVFEDGAAFLLTDAGRVPLLPSA